MVETWSLASASVFYGGDRASEQIKIRRYLD